MAGSLEAWIGRTRERHTRCLNWQSDGAVALALTVPVPDPAPLTERYTRPEVILEHQSHVAETIVQVRSDQLPCLHPCFNAAVLFSGLGGRVELHGQDIHYVPNRQSWVFDAHQPVPPPDSGLFPNVLAAMEHLAQHAPSWAAVTTPYFHTPLNTAALLRDPAAFYLDVLDQPDEIHRVLATVTKTFIESQRLLHARLGRGVTPSVAQEGIHLADMTKFSDDCCVNLGPAHIEEFDVAYTQKIAAAFDMGVATHYCVLPDKGQLAEHCIEPNAGAAHVRVLCNQYTPEYFLQNYERFDRRLALVSQSGSVTRFGATPAERAQRFKTWATEFLTRFAGRSGLIIQWSVPTVAEAQKLFGIWESVNRWSAPAAQ